MEEIAEVLYYYLTATTIVPLPISLDYAVSSFFNGREFKMTLGKLQGVVRGGTHNPKQRSLLPGSSFLGGLARAGVMPALSALTALHLPLLGRGSDVRRQIMSVDEHAVAGVRHGAEILLGSDEPGGSGQIAELLDQGLKSRRLILSALRTLDGLLFGRHGHGEFDYVPPLLLVLLPD